ncbi:tetratricopeptide repeat protein [Alkalimarinus coralli]|uniref:tetratricopeptide repeat protein n=1 Tax=Alkalimarinus coralli TaxID=2935863 RepID=UPI00202B514F|nr:tetratricopeptide repeat protein [Alkalimarinus coralli]
MSLMNDMLRDLEKRQAPDRTQQVEAQGYGALTQQTNANGSRTVILLLAAILVMLLLLAAGWWYLQRPAEVAVGTDIVEQNQAEPTAREVIGKVVRTPSTKVASEASAVSDSSEGRSLPSRAVQSEPVAAPAPVAEAAKVNIAQLDAADVNSAPETSGRARNIEVQANNDSQLTPAAEPEIGNSQLPEQPKPQAVIAKQTAKAVEPVKQQTIVEEKKAAKVAASKPESAVMPERNIAEPIDQVAKLSKVLVVTPEQKDEAAAESASKLIASGNQQQAKAQLYSFVKNHDVDIQSRALLVTQLLQAGDMQGASALLTEEKLAISAHLRRLKAHMLSQKGQPDEAIALLNSTLPDVATDPEYHVLLAALYQQQGFSSEATAIYAELLNFNPDVADWWVGMAIALDSRQQYLSAKKAYQKALSMNGLKIELADFAKRRLATLGG